MMTAIEANEPTRITAAPTPSRMPGAADNDHRARSAMAIRMQRAAILAHCSDMARRLGRPVSLDEAAREWIPIYAEMWRHNFEKQIAARTFSIRPSDGIRPSDATPGRT